MDILLDIFNRDIVNIILDYKYLFEHKEKFQKTLNKIKKLDRSNIKYYNSYGINNWEFVTDYYHYINFFETKYNDMQIIYVKRDNMLIFTILDNKTNVIVDELYLEKYYKIIMKSLLCFSLTMLICNIIK